MSSTMGSIKILVTIFVICSITGYVYGCSVTGQECYSYKQCCSFKCENGRCLTAEGKAGTCKLEGAACQYGYECCSKTCNPQRPFGGKCGNDFSKLCGASGDACKNHDDCCSHRCEDRHYGGKRCYSDKTPGAHSCKKESESCAKDLDCCSKKCIRNKWAAHCAKGDFKECIHGRGQCVADKDCCSKKCILPTVGQPHCK